MPNREGSSEIPNNRGGDSLLDSSARSRIRKFDERIADKEIKQGDLDQQGAKRREQPAYDEISGLSGVVGIRNPNVGIGYPTKDAMWRDHELQMNRREQGRAQVAIESMEDQLRYANRNVIDDALAQVAAKFPSIFTDKFIKPDNFLAQVRRYADHNVKDSYDKYPLEKLIEIDSVLRSEIEKATATYKQAVAQADARRDRISRPTINEKSQGLFSKLLNRRQKVKHLTSSEHTKR